MNMSTEAQQISLKITVDHPDEISDNFSFGDQLVIILHTEPNWNAETILEACKVYGDTYSYNLEGMTLQNTTMKELSAKFKQGIYIFSQFSKIPDTLFSTSKGSDGRRRVIRDTRPRIILEPHTPSFGPLD